MDLLLATQNKNKIFEIKNKLKSLNINILTLDDIKFFNDIEETGLTFMENVLIKAKTIYNLTKLNVLADDSGLSCYALDGKPGIHSKRFSKEQTDSKNNELLLKLLKDKDNKKAYYTCAMVLILDGKIYEFEEKVEGIIIDKYMGNNGFGYDPIFYYPPLNKTFAMLSVDEKNKYSHRALCLEKVKKLLKDYISE